LTELLGRRTFPQDEIFSKSINIDNSIVTLIGTDEHFFNDSCSLEHEIEIHLLNKSWSSLSKDSGSFSERDDRWERIFELGEPIMVPNWQGNEELIELIFRRLLRCRKCINGDHYFLLIDGTEGFDLYIIFLSFILNLNKINLGFIPLHAAAVIRNGWIYLFLGPSGSGKSTLAQLSRKIGSEILDEDQVLLHRCKDVKGCYSVNAWAYDTRQSELPIRAVFKLQHSRIDKINPLGQLQVASLLMKSHLQIMRDGPGILPSAFHFISEAARSMPGYHLYFRKSHEFWELIDRLPLNN